VKERGQIQKDMDVMKDRLSMAVTGRGFHSSTLRLDVSTFRGMRWVY